MGIINLIMFKKISDHVMSYGSYGDEFWKMA